MEQDISRDGWTYQFFDTFEEADAADAAQWLEMTPIERLRALEMIRAANYGYARPDQPRPEFQRLYRVDELRKR